MRPSYTSVARFKSAPGSTMRHLMLAPCRAGSPVVTSVISTVLLLVIAVHIRAEDWPEWRGKGRLGVWNETGIVDKFPDGGLPVSWRTSINAGYSGPSVGDGRVFVTDSRRGKANQAIERAIAI